MSTNAININDDEFEEEVENSSLPVLVDFWAEWCGPCRQLSPILEELSKDMAGKLKVVKINVDENLEISNKFGVRGLPTMILFKEGKPFATKVGSSPKSVINEWIEKSINP